MKIGITGGIGSGKSYVAKTIENEGHKVFNADIIAKEIMKDDDSVRELIIAEFGKEAYDGEEINRKYLAEKAFSSVENIRLLNSIVHPPMVHKINELMTNELKNTKLVFVEAALIYEAEIDAILDYVLLVTADKETRIKRIVERDSLSEEEILNRMKYQIPEDEKENLADFTIKNNSSLFELEMRTKMFLKVFESMAT